MDILAPTRCPSVLSVYLEIVVDPTDLGLSPHLGTLLYTFCCLFGIWGAVCFVLRLGFPQYPPRFDKFTWLDYRTRENTCLATHYKGYYREYGEENTMKRWMAGWGWGKRHSTTVPSTRPSYMETLQHWPLDSYGDDWSKGNHIFPSIRTPYLRSSNTRYVWRIITNWNLSPDPSVFPSSWIWRMKALATYIIQSRSKNSFMASSKAETN